jgi:FkbM family methyltransferase
MTGGCHAAGIRQRWVALVGNPDWTDSLGGPSMTAEHDVDRRVREAFFPKAKSGVLVEVGAARPDFLSIGASFHTLGWKVIAIEPNPAFCAAHRALGRPVLEYAVSDTEGDDVPFYVVDSRGAAYADGQVSAESFSSLGIQGPFADLYSSVKAHTDMTTIQVKVRKLDSILATHHPELGVIDILVVDVEGWELNVMRGLSLRRYRPKVVVLENNFSDPQYPSFMHSRDYELWARLPPNEVYRFGDSA